MGWIRHHAIVVVGWDPAIAKAHEIALAVFGPETVSAPTPAQINGYRTFCVGVDGSKEGWPESEAGDKRRALFAERMRRVSVDWVVVSMDVDNSFAEVVGGNVREADRG